MFLLLIRPTMHFSARKTIATTLAALLAVLACAEHALHDVSHVHVGESRCQSGKPEAVLTRSCCSHDHGCRETTSSPESDAPPEHDSENCAVCRFLALPQLFEPPQELLSATEFVSDHIAESPLSPTVRIVTLVPIRGPPLS